MTNTNTNSQNVSYFASNPRRAPTVTIFQDTPTSANYKGFYIMDEAYVPSTKKWYKLLSLDGNQADWQLQASDQSDFIAEVVTDSGTAIPVQNIINLLGGTGANTSASGNTITVNSTGGGYEWTVVNSATQTIEVNKAYFSNRAGGVAFTLPATAAIGDTFKIVSTSGLFTVAQNASQQIRCGNVQTTAGVGGSLASTSVGDGIHIACYSTDIGFVVIDGPQGTFTVV